MTTRRSWLRSNALFLAAIPVLVAGVAYSQTALDGSARTVAQIVLAVALILVTIRVAWSARPEKNRTERR